jgi:uncharacterized protein
MLVRIFINDILSFHTGKEFNMLPQPRFSRLKHHSYESANTTVLKMSALYGPNGAGKSNLIKSLALVQEIITGEVLPGNISKNFFRLTDKEVNPKIGIEFISSGKQYLYGIELAKNTILTEELYISGLGKKDDRLIFERRINDEGSIDFKFSESFEAVQENLMLKSIIEKNLAKKNKSSIRILSDLDNSYFKDVKAALDWFSIQLKIIMPESKPGALAHLIDIDSTFHDYAEEIMCSYNVGVSSLTTTKINIKDFFNNEEVIENLIEKLNNTESNMLGLRNDKGGEIIIIEENDEVFVKEIKVNHRNTENNTFQFDIEEESDGTIRLMDFIPAFRDIILSNCVYVIDEIERTIHPLLIKELIRKISDDTGTKGQLIFSTHESNLLDQEIFRQDEIWFAEKDKDGCTDIYSLSDYKEHNTKDIRKGYLQGRYGSIPFLSNLKDLNWHNYDFKE